MSRYHALKGADFDCKQDGKSVKLQRVALVTNKALDGKFRGLPQMTTDTELRKMGPAKGKA